MSFYDLLEKHADKTALIQEETGAVTYAELASFSDSIASPIACRKALVFIFCRNNKESVAGYLGCLRKGHVPLLLDSAINKDLAQNLIMTYQPNYIWAPEGFFDIGEVKFSEGGYMLCELNLKQHDLHPDLALLLTTSGSTGSPKLVRQSYKNIDANSRSIAEYLELTETERPITTLPMNYTYGLSIINSHLLAGATILLTGYTIMQKEFWSFLKQHGATSFGGVPYTYEMLKKLRFFRMDIPSLRTMTQAGGKLNMEMTKEYAEFCAEKGIRFFVMYGQTEATARMSYLPHQYALPKCGSMGIAIPGGKFSLVDEQGNEIQEADVPGELIYEGPNVTLGYAECLLDLAKGDENRGVLITGDMAKRDEDGFYYIVGRKKRFLKLFGNRVNLDEIEQMIRSKGYECACTGTDDNLLIALTDKSAVAEIERYIPAVMGIHKSAVRVVHISEIPKNEAGKTIYAKLQEAAL